MYQEAVMVPVGQWKRLRLKHLRDADTLRASSNTGSRFAKNMSKWVDRKQVYPTNVLHLATECGNTGHSAAFPRRVPDWFIRLFSKPGDVVLDPFAGSGTTCSVPKELGRRFIGI